MIMHLNGIVLPQRGEVKIDGRTVDKASAREIKRKVGIVFQDPDDQVFSTTVWEDVAFGPVNTGVPEEIVRDTVDRALKLLDVWHLKDKMPYHLSYGQKKRVALAGILAMDSDIIAFDEPGTCLDPKGRRDLIEILHELHRDRKTLLIATHDINFASQWADNIIILKEGRLLKTGDRNLLLEEEILREAHLTPPLIPGIFLQAGYEKNEVPLTEEEAVAILEKAIQ